MVKLWFSEWRDLTAANGFFCKSLKRHGSPERIVIIGSQINSRAIASCDAVDRLQSRPQAELKPICISSAYLNNRIGLNHCAIKRRIRPMLGFKSTKSFRAIPSGIEMVHVMRKQRGKYACTHQPSFIEQFERPTAQAAPSRPGILAFSARHCDRAI